MPPCLYVLQEVKKLSHDPKAGLFREKVTHGCTSFTTVLCVHKADSAARLGKLMVCVLVYEVNRWCIAILLGNRGCAIKYHISIYISNTKSHNSQQTCCSFLSNLRQRARASALCTHTSCAMHVTLQNKVPKRSGCQVFFSLNRKTHQILYRHII